MKLLKNILSVALSNIAGYATKILSTIVLPIILSQAGYGAYTKYLALLSLTYIFNFGFNDGIYIKYGGREASELKHKYINKEHNFVLIFQILIFLIMLMYSLITKNIIFTFFSFSTLFDTINTYHQNFLQATGQFKVYSKGNIYKSVYTLVILVVFVFLLKFDNYLYYIILNASTFLFIVLFYEYNFYKNYTYEYILSFEGLSTIFRIGIFMLIGNASLTLAGNIGAYVGSANYSDEVFAQYGFQNSILNSILLIANAVGMVFYNLIAKGRDDQKLNTLKKACYFTGVFSGTAFFIFKWGILNVLPLLTSSNYEPSVDLLSITFIAIPYIMISKMLIANIYKVSVSEKKYVLDSVIYVVFTAILVLISQYTFRSLRYIAIATTVSYIMWYVYATQIKFTYLRNNIKENILLVSHIVVFYTLSSIGNIYIGLVLYLLYLGIIVIVFKKDFKEMKRLLRK